MLFKKKKKHVHDLEDCFDLFLHLVWVALKKFKSSILNKCIKCEDSCCDSADIVNIYICISI